MRFRTSCRAWATLAAGMLVACTDIVATRRANMPARVMQPTQSQGRCCWLGQVPVVGRTVPAGRLACVPLCSGRHCGCYRPVRSLNGDLNVAVWQDNPARALCSEEDQGW
jgi:hypothetical protein